MVKKLQDDFKNKYQCDLTCKLDSIDWLSLRMNFSHVVIKSRSTLTESVALSKDEPWTIEADRFVLSASWWAFVTQFRCKLSGSFDHIIMHERYDGKSSQMFEFLKRFFAKSPAKFVVYDWMSISDGLLFVECDDGLQLYIPYNCNMSCERSGTRMQFYSQKGTVSMQKKMIIEDVSGSFVLDIPERDIVKGMGLQLNMGMRIVPLGQKGMCFAVGALKNGSGNFTLKNEDMSLVMDQISLRIDSKKCLFDASTIISAVLGKELGMHAFFEDVHGAMRIECCGDLYDFFNTLRIDVLIDDMLYKSTKVIQNVKASVHYASFDTLSGLFEIGNKQFFEFNVSVHKETMHLKCSNSRDLAPLDESYWKVPARCCEIDIVFDTKNGWSGSYSILLKNDKLQKQKKLCGTVEFKDQRVHLQGEFDDISYEIIVNLAQNMMLEKAIFIQNNKKIVDFFVDENNKESLFGVIDFLCIKEIVSEQFKSSFTQDGMIKFHGYVKDGVYYSQMSTEQANIRIPKIYNVVQNIVASCEFDFYNRCIRIKDVKAELHEGELVCSQANFFFNSFGNCYFMHVPCLLHNVLMSWDKGIFMLISGGVLFHTAEQKKLQIDGQIVVEKSQLKENIFSSEFQESLFGTMLGSNKKDAQESSCLLNVAIVTKELLRVKTSFLSAHAKLDLLLRGTLKKPELTGLIELVSGSFYFPYKPLDIVDGKLFFLPDQQFDPLIEVTAKGKLKRYGVSMHVTGSIFDPAVQFDAMPYLTEDQIISLLLLGIEESSLSAIHLPALLTQKLKDLVFGPALSKTKLQSKFDRLLQSLKYFRFLPQFTNQTGRGGVRGLFEVDASDHVHGKIDVNFMQLEDTKFDMDLAITDDITFRAQKDGPSTYGGEVEFCWKFD